MSQPSPALTVRGSVAVPGDKSISHRALLFAALARGTSRVRRLLDSADIRATAGALRACGVLLTTEGADAVVQGVGRRGLSAPSDDLDCANSGTTARLLSGILAAHPFRARLVGDASLSRRPMRRVIAPLAAMGATLHAERGDGLPMTITGADLRSIDWVSDAASAQVKSAILLAGLTATGTTTVAEPLPTRDHTERAFPAFGLRVTVDPDAHAVSVVGPQEATAPTAALRVPGDPSTAAVWAAAAAALPGSRVELTGVCLNPHRLGFVRALQRMGAQIEMVVDGEVAGEPVGTIHVAHGTHETAVIEPADVPGLIDELPVLAARAALGAGLSVSGAGELRVKESDRISALVAGFRALGVSADERPDGFVIDGSHRPRGGVADAAADHRLVMAFSLVALGAAGGSTVTGAEAVAVSYPDFARELGRLTE